MGCWNETCVLTHLPIHSGMPVIALPTVYGPAYRSPNITAKTDLLFGLPLAGEYDDYGGIDALQHPALDALQEKAFEDSGFYKKWVTKSSYGSESLTWVASHADTFWSLNDAIKPLYYAELGICMSDLSSHDKAAQEKTTKAFEMSRDALANLGTSLGAATLGSNESTAHNELFAVFERVFGPDRAWPAWNAVRNKGLFASRDLILMHQPAYQALVTEFGQRKVGHYHSKKRYPMREFIAMELDKWLENYPAEYKRLERLWGDPDGLLSPAEQRREVLRYAENRKKWYLSPMTSLWMSTELPLIGHFWGGATVEEIMAVAPKDVIVDYFVFQWARSYLRIDLTKPGSGSQNGEVVLPGKIFRETMKALKAQNFVRKDFDGTLFS